MVGKIDNPLHGFPRWADHPPPGSPESSQASKNISETIFNFTRITYSRITSKLYTAYLKHEIFFVIKKNQNVRKCWRHRILDVVAGRKVDVSLHILLMNCYVYCWGYIWIQYYAWRICAAITKLVNYHFAQQIHDTLNDHITIFVHNHPQKYTNGIFRNQSWGFNIKFILKVFLLFQWFEQIHCFHLTISESNLFS